MSNLIRMKRTLNYFIREKSSLSHSLKKIHTTPKQEKYFISLDRKRIETYKEEIEHLHTNRHSFTHLLGHKVRRDKFFM